MELIFLGLVAIIGLMIGLWAFLCLASAIKKHGIKGVITGFFRAITQSNNKKHL